MANLMQLNVLSPDSYVFQADNISYIDAHTEGGAVGILPRHATMVAALDAAPLKYRDDNGVAHYLFVDTGYLEVKDNVVTVLSVAAELAESIDVEKAQAALERAKAKIENLDQEIDLPAAQADLKRAEARLKTVTLSKSKE
ncbi:MAG: ATP synthase F1 subunit epsilon [Succiniclasticum sp.]|nr:ATP synthase F1 subunit epsilon [Succiniclasticum sp.]MCI6222477.1 ATP synthase F1 subunit epsilon [Selenomonadales bacterium]MDY2869894.1 ATP synthase F1 subunit epsilon [Succiniclasticum sp.]MDY6303643.1 ATP synthase F1 subunit epsilon [Succiniclasticum sp.]MDY6345599.1 ATP synthase F1 subunit epsilon [Succiniclasticum sp.]